jgi:hypothetical protein
MSDLIEGSIPPVEVSLDLIRMKRDELLNNCDFVLMPDYPVTGEKLSEWRVYRQALRDITNTIDMSLLIIVVEETGELDIGGFTWPTPPT